MTIEVELLCHRPKQGERFLYLIDPKFAFRSKFSLKNGRASCMRGIECIHRREFISDS